ncbi:MAG: PEP-CTERM sorting domain-containing protein [Pyrinomonadaceae bacterium]
MSTRALRPTAAILSILLLAGTPVQAGPVAIREVIQVIGGYQNPPELRLRSFSQTSAPVSGLDESTRADSRLNTSTVDNHADLVDSSAGDATSSDTLLSGIANSTCDPKAGIEVIDVGDVAGTICDCGEITVAGGFPKWPLLFLAAIPFFFIHDCDDCDTQTPTPTPTPTTRNTPTPEPASLLLFGSGLVAIGAGLRRRYGKPKVRKQVGEEG